MENPQPLPLNPQEIFHRIHFDPLPGLPEASPLVFLHGLMGFAANWGKIWPAFHQGRKVLVLDQRGHGRSAKPGDGYGPESYAADLAGLLDHLGWPRAHIVGHSMGGRVALSFAHRYPEKTISLTMEDSGAEARPDRENWIRDLLLSIPTPFASREEAKIFFMEHFRSDPLTGSFLHSNLEAREDGRLDWRFHAPGMIETVVRGRATDAMEEFRSIRAPTLLVRGGRSHEFPADEAERMHRSRAGVKLVTIPGVGHYVHSEAPGEFSAALRDFLAGVEAGG